LLNYRVVPLPRIHKRLAPAVYLGWLGSTPAFYLGWLGSTPAFYLGWIGSTVYHNPT